MRIGIDARPLARARAGISRVVESLIVELQRIDQENHYYLYSHCGFDIHLGNPRWQKRVAWWPSFLPGTLWLETVAKTMILRDCVDVFWGTEHALPLGLPAAVGKVVMVHDLVWRFYPETMSAFNRCMHGLFVERSIRQADKVISVSESTARDLQRILKIPESKIEVIHPGVGPAYKPHDPRPAARYVAGQYGVSEDYILTVGTVEPRKNLTTLMEAMKVLRDRGELSFQLLVAGASGWKDAGIHRSLRQSGLTQDDVRFLGFVPEVDLPVLYAGARLFVFPSLYEGFGLPLVEAMACGAPIVASNTSSVPEVVQDAALLVSPAQPADFAGAILRVRGDADLRRAMIHKGLQRADCFRWDRAASRILECMERVAAKREGHGPE